MTQETGLPAPLSSPLPALQTTCVPTQITPSPTNTPGVTTSPTATPEALAGSPTAPPPAEVLSIALYEERDMVPGQRARLTGTEIEITLVEAHGPPEGCDDCPSRATLEVNDGGDVQMLYYSVSGIMQLELLSKALRKSAFGYVFVAHRIAEGEFTLRVEPETE